MHSPLTLSRFRPQLIDAVKGYNRERFFKDLGARVASCEASRELVAVQGVRAIQWSTVGVAECV